MDKQIREDGILVFNALVMSKAVFSQIPRYDPKGVQPEMVGWVNCDGEWFVADHNGRLVRFTRVEAWNIVEATEQHRDPQAIQDGINKFRDNLRQIYVK